MNVTTVLAGAGTGLGIWSAYQQKRAADRIANQMPLPPANYFVYDDMGNIVASQVWDEARGGYVYRENPEPQRPEAPKIERPQPPREEDFYYLDFDNQAWYFDERGYKQALAEYEEAMRKFEQEMANYKKEVADYEKRHAEWAAERERRAEERKYLQGLKEKYLKELDVPLDELMSKWDAYANEITQESFAKTKQAAEEEMAARGLYGSRAYADRLAEIDVGRGRLVTDIKRDLAEGERAYAMGMLGYIDSGASADVARRLNQQAAMGAIARGVSDYRLSEFANRQQQQWNAWQARSQFANNLLNTASGLMFLYGLGGGPGGGLGSGLGGRSGVSSFGRYMTTPSFGNYGF